MGRQSLTVTAEWKAGAAGSGEVEGYASVFGVVDSEGDVVMPGAFQRTIDHWSKASQPMPLIADHQLTTEGVIGSVHHLSEDRTGLRFKARFGRTQKAQDIRANVLDGHLRGVSYTYEPVAWRPGNGNLAGKAIRRFLDEVKAYEITLSPFPVLEAAGVTSAKAVVDRPWDGSAARFTDDQYRRSCLIDRGGDAPVKQRCSLPVREPNGDVNRNALGPAAAALAGGRGGLAGVSAELKARAARALVRLYSEADMDPPENLRRMAGMMSAAQSDLLASMEHAIAIIDPFARKAAIDVLMDQYRSLDDVSGPEDAPATTPDPAPQGTSGDGAPADAYALSFLTDNGSSDGTPTGDPPPALPVPLVVLEHERTSAEMDRLEADLNRALEG